MKKIIWIVFLLLMSFPSISTADEIPCVAGNCNGWYVSYNQNNEYLIFKYENNTGSPAFWITCKINFYDAGGNHIGSFTNRHEGPIRKQIMFQSRYPNNISRMEAEIYYKREY